ncbi:MAG: hypothetical protein Q8Q96_00930 [bacterium]|nr:hypothetical protein [bacterium]
MVIFWLLLFLAVFSEVLTTLPLAFILLVVFYALKRETWLFIAAFFAGILLDLILVRTIGTSSLFFVIFLFVEEIYGRKFETQTLPFVLLAAFIGSIFYLLIFHFMILGQTLIFQQSIVTSMLALGVFKLLKYLKL